MAQSEAVQSKAPISTPVPDALPSEPDRERVSDEVRLRRIFDEQFTFIWRYLRRMGLSEADADDATQRVFLVLARKLDDIDIDKERAFLCGTASRVYSEVRRARIRRREVGGDAIAEPVDQSLGPDDLADRQKARALLDQVLDQMDEKVRAVFVLFELEELSTAQIAEMLELPPGTVASRLRRARESFGAIVKRMRAGGQLPGANR
jgi:RNA polymerase sigma-70 factor (ECF subfamily)